MRCTSAGPKSNGSAGPSSLRPAFASLSGLFPPKKVPLSLWGGERRVSRVDFQRSLEFVLSSSPRRRSALSLPEEQLVIGPYAHLTYSNDLILSYLKYPTGSCERVENYYNASLPVNPCPVFNVRVSFTVSPIPFERPNISTVIHWDLPHGTLNVIMI